MKKFLALSVIFGLLLAGTANPAPATFKALFCPECWDYVEGPGSMDMRGNCGVCGKYPVEMEANRVSWLWCEGGKKWRRTPCPESWMKRCCVQEESLAAVAAPGRGTFEAWYCPSHRQFYVFRLPILMQTVCRTCARPAVKVDAMEKAWFWCATDGLWYTEACSMNPVQKCCAKRDGTLLVRLDPGPIAK